MNNEKVIIIQDFSIPKDCSDCPMNYDDMFCSLNECKFDLKTWTETRLSNCPLKEIELR